MTPTEQDKELRAYIAERFGMDKNEDWYDSYRYNDRVKMFNYITADRKRVALEARIEGEKVGAFMAASSILIEMSPLMVHRLGRDFPSMTAEVIGTVYETVKREMKPYQDSRKAQQEEV